jgi:hypothetical protein
VGKKEKGRGSLTKRSSPSSKIETGGVDRTVGPAGAGDCRCPGVGGGRRQVETGRRTWATFPDSHLGRGRPVEVAPRRGTGGGGSRRRWRNWWRWRARGKRGMVVEVRGAAGSHAGPLYRRGKVGSGGKYPPGDRWRRAAAWLTREGSRRGRRGSVRDSWCGAVGYDPSCRWAGQWRRQRRCGVVSACEGGGDRSSRLFGVELQS